MFHVYVRDEMPPPLPPRPPWADWPSTDWRPWAAPTFEVACPRYVDHSSESERSGYRFFQGRGSERVWNHEKECFVKVCGHDLRKCYCRNPSCCVTDVGPQVEHAAQIRADFAALVEFRRCLAVARRTEGHVLQRLSSSGWALQHRRIGSFLVPCLSAEASTGVPFAPDLAIRRWLDTFRVEEVSLDEV